MIKKFKESISALFGKKKENSNKETLREERNLGIDKKNNDKETKGSIEKDVKENKEENREIAVSKDTGNKSHNNRGEDSRRAPKRDENGSRDRNYNKNKSYNRGGKQNQKGDGEKKYNQKKSYGNGGKYKNTEKKFKNNDDNNGQKFSRKSMQLTKLEGELKKIHAGDVLQMDSLSVKIQEKNTLGIEIYSEEFKGRISFSKIVGAFYEISTKEEKSKGDNDSIEEKIIFELVKNALN